MNPETAIREGLDDLAAHYREVLNLLGEDPDREGLEKTPMRVAKAMQILTRGYTQDPRKVLTDALFEEKYWDFAQKADGKICNVPKKKETSLFLFL